jgi:hypothetical protein
VKIIEALKKMKDLQRKADDIRAKIRDNCADIETATPAYGTVEAQAEHVCQWLQAHSDIISEILHLRLLVQKTNLVTEVSVEVTDGYRVTKSIAAWIHRRKDLAKLEATAWSVLTNRSLQPKGYSDPTNKDLIKVANIRKYYDQKTRDTRVELYTSEPSRIDAALEITNAVTDLVE